MFKNMLHGCLHAFFFSQVFVERIADYDVYSPKDIVK